MDMIIDFIQNNWAGIMSTISTGGIGLFAIKQLIKGNKININFDGLVKESKESNKTTKSIGKIVYEGLDKFENVIEKLIERVDGVENSNSLLINLLVITLSTANIPLSQKQSFHTALLKVGSVSDEAINLLAENIKADKDKEIELEVEADETEELINSINA